MSLIKIKKSAPAQDRAPDGFWNGKNIEVWLSNGQHFKGKIVSYKGGMYELHNGVKFHHNDVTV